MTKTTSDPVKATPKQTRQKGYIAAYKLELQEKLDASKRAQDVILLWGTCRV